MVMYRKATTKASALAMSQKTEVKYSELARLPYFNMVENFLIDPMHSILMGLVSDLGEELITNSNNLMTGGGGERHLGKQIECREGALRSWKATKDNARQDVSTRVESATMDEFHCHLCKGLFMECSTKQIL